VAQDRVKMAQQADKLAAQGKVDAAIAQYELLVRENPSDVITINKIGDLYSRLGRKPEAIHQFNKIGAQFTKDGFYSKAIAIYKKVLKLDSSSIEALHRIGDLFAQQGQVNEARAHYAQVVEHYTRTGETKKAIAVHQLLARMEPGNLKLRTSLVDLLQKDGRGAEAAEEMLALAGELEKKGRHDEAKAMLQKASGMGKGSRQFASRLASHQLQGNDPDAAARTATEALKNAADAPELLAILGQAHMKRERHDEAEQIFRRLAQIEPARCEHHLVLAQILGARGDQTAAAGVITSQGAALKKAGKTVEAAAVLESTGWRESKDRPLLRAVIEAMRSLSSGDQGAAVMSRLLDLCLEAGAVDEAIPLGEDLTRMLPGDAKLREKLARARAGAQKAAPAPAPQQAAAAPRKEAAPAAEPASPRRRSAGQTEAAGLAMHADLPPPLNLEPEDEDFITEHMTEADVFMKYGLADRAIEQLGTVVEKFPAHVPAHEKLREIYMEDGNRPAAREQIDLLVRAHLAAGDQSAAESMLDELRRFDPDYSELAVLERAVRSSGQPLGSSAGDARAAAEAEVDAADGPPREELQEVDFYIGQGMMQEASGNLQRLMQRFGKHAEIVRRMDAIASSSRKAPAAAADARPGRAAAAPANEEEHDEFEIEMEEEAPAAESRPAAPAPVRKSVPPEQPKAAPRGVTPPPPAKHAQQAAASAAASQDLLDLAGEIDSALTFADEAAEVVAPSAEAEPEGSSLSEIVEAFKKGVEQQVGAEDVDTHYNLGIAYKEMGLLDEAIGEFQLAAKERRLLVDCACMLGICFREKGLPVLAVKWYRRGLEAAGDRDEETVLGLRYDLADLLAAQGEVKPALDLFEEVYGSNTKFRDVAQKLKELQTRTAG